MATDTPYNRVKPKFNYETDISPFDLIKDPEILVKKMERLSILCKNCKSPFTFRFRETYISQKCRCGMRIFYPQENNIYTTSYIPKALYYKNRQQQQEVLKWERGNK